MALFAQALDVDSQHEQHECPVNWYSQKADF